MDFDKLIASVYDWISFDKAVWFMLFFWISLPVLFLVPVAIEVGFFYSGMHWAIELMYVLMYVVVLLAFMVLTSNCLSHKKFSSTTVNLNKFLDTLFLVFLEFWHVFVWNVHRAYRFTQLLLLVGIPLLYYYYTTSFSAIIEIAYWVFVIAYLAVVIYNAVRLCFSVSIFYSGGGSALKIRDVVKKSWHLTHKRFWEVLFSLIVIFATVFVLFVVISVVLGIIANFILVMFTTAALAYKLSVAFATFFAIAPSIVGYHLGFAELYAQLNKKHESNNRIKNVLAKRAIGKVKEKVKKKVKKKSTKKKSKKKTSTRKKKKSKK
jgi:hypothetical protein